MMEDKKPEKADRPIDPKPAMSEREIDLNLIETFPASDPPSWTLGTDHRDESTDIKGTDESEADALAILE